jgi:hypothetical protein
MLMLDSGIEIHKRSPRLRFKPMTYRERESFTDRADPPVSRLCTDRTSQLGKSLSGRDGR